MVQPWSSGPLPPHLPHPASHSHTCAVLQLCVMFSSPCLSPGSASLVWNTMAFHFSFSKWLILICPLAEAPASVGFVNCLPSGHQSWAQWTCLIINFFLPAPPGMWNPSSSSRDGTCIPCLKSIESYALDHQRSSQLLIFETDPESVSP